MRPTRTMRHLRLALHFSGYRTQTLRVFLSPVVPRSRPELSNPGPVPASLTGSWVTTSFGQLAAEARSSAALLPAFGAALTRGPVLLSAAADWQLLLPTAVLH